MKKILAVSLLVLLATVVFAQTPERNLVFEWDQVIVPDLAGWNLYMTETSGSNYVRVSEIIYDGSPGPVFSDNFVVVGTIGQVKQLYFVLTAFDQDGNESDFSNEAQARIDFESPNAPFTFTVRIVKP